MIQHKLVPFQVTLTGPVVDAEALCGTKGTLSNPISLAFENADVTCSQCIDLIKNRRLAR